MNPSGLVRLVRPGTPVVVLLVVAAYAMYELSAHDYLTGWSGLRWAADSVDYHAYYAAAGLDQGLAGVGYNLFGPLMLLYLTDGDPRAIFVLNIAVFLAGWAIAVNALPLRSLAFAALLAINPMIVVSLLAVNKEIIAFAATTMYAAWLFRKNRLYLLGALAFAFFVRWQFVLVLLVFEALRSPVNPFRERRLLTLTLVLAGLSAVYPFLDPYLGTVIAEEVRRRQAETSFGLLELANEIQRNFGYFLVAVPKILANWFGNMARVARLVYDLPGFDLHDLYNTFVIPLYQLAMCVVVGLLLVTRRFRLSDDLVYFGLFYSIVFALSMFIQYRYFLPVYLVFAMQLSLARDGEPRTFSGIDATEGGSHRPDDPRHTSIA